MVSFHRPDCQWLEAWNAIDTARRLDRGRWRNYLLMCILSITGTEMSDEVMALSPYSCIIYELPWL